MGWLACTPLGKSAIASLRDVTAHPSTLSPTLNPTPSAPFTALSCPRLRLTITGSTPIQGWGESVNPTASVQFRHVFVDFPSRLASLASVSRGLASSNIRQLY